MNLLGWQVTFLVRRAIWSGVRFTGISNFLFSTFHGGSDEARAPSKTVTVYYANFAVVPGLSVRSVPGEG